jgi:hypothetical protein
MTVTDHIAAPMRLTRYTLALNYLPLAQLVTGAALIAVYAPSTTVAVAWALAWLYLLPPLACRLAFALFGAPHGRALTQDDRAYKVWWFSYKCQILFNRLPWLEEILRLAPGLYALWLWLWGARVSPLVYWGPGSLVVDRPLVIIEPGVIVAGHAGITAHTATIDANGAYALDVAPVWIGRGAMMGARSGLSAGCELAPYQMLPAGRLVKPFTRWEGMKRSSVSPTEDDDA